MLPGLIRTLPDKMSGNPGQSACVPSSDGGEVRDRDRRLNLDRQSASLVGRDRAGWSCRAGCEGKDQGASWEQEDACVGETPAAQFLELGRDPKMGDDYHGASTESGVRYSVLGTRIREASLCTSSRCLIITSITTNVRRVHQILSKGVLHNSVVNHACMCISPFPECSIDCSRTKEMDCITVNTRIQRDLT